MNRRVWVVALFALSLGWFYLTYLSGLLPTSWTGNRHTLGMLVGSAGGFLGAIVLDTLVFRDDVPTWPTVCRSIAGFILGVMVGFVQQSDRLCPNVPGCIVLRGEEDWQGLIVVLAFCVSVAMTHVVARLIVLFRGGPGGGGKATA